MKVARTVRAGGKGSDNFKSLPICINKDLLLSMKKSIANIGCYEAR